MIALVEVTDPDQHHEYVKHTPAAIQKYGAKLLSRGGRSTTLEGPAAPGRIVMVEFDSFERALEHYNSPEHQGAKKYREGAATAQFMVVEGT